MRTLHDVLRDLTERGDIIPDMDLTPGVWHTIKFSVFTTADDVMYFDDPQVIPNDPERDAQ